MGLATTARRLGWTGICAGAAIVLAASPVAADAGTATGPSSSASPYLVPTADGVVIESIITAGDSVNGYRMVGIPDGLGLMPQGDGTFRVLMNHEIPAGEGVARRHGSNGAFVSSWEIGASDLAVQRGSDLIRYVYTYDRTGGAWVAGTTAFNRFCSATLAPRSAFWNAATRKGYNGDIFMNGEETSGGRAFAHVVTGKDARTSYELPSLGRLAFENAVANPSTGDRTVVISTDDTNPLGQVYVYVGQKRSTGNPVERAGLSGGTLYGVSVAGTPTATRTIAGTAYQASVETITDGIDDPATTTYTGAFTLSSFGDVSGAAWTGGKLQDESVKQGVTEFLRPEDGAWDPVHPNDFYFVTTNRFDTAQDPQSEGSVTTSQVGNSRLWRLRFNDVTNPAAAGTISMLLDGVEGVDGKAPQMMDNITVDTTGHVLIQEDPGNQEYLAKIWSYDIATDALTQIAAFDPARFGVAANPRVTIDEESSGIIDASAALGPGWFLAAVQSHKSLGGEIVEDGQLIAIYNPASDPTR